MLGAYADAARRGALLVVPTAIDARHYARELAGDGVVLGSVVTFSGAGLRGRRRGAYAGRRVSELQRERILERVLAGSRLDVLRASASAAGFAAAAGELIAELQRSLVDPGRFITGLRAWAAQDVRRAPYAHEVGRIYGDYVRELDRLGRVDRELYAWRALDALRAAPYRWGPASRCSSTALTTSPRSSATRWRRWRGWPAPRSPCRSPTSRGARRSWPGPRRWRSCGRWPSASSSCPAQDEHYAPASRAVLHHLERSLFAAGPSQGRMDPGRAVTLLEAGGERAEAELVAEQVLELMRAGVPAGEIVVIYRSRPPAAPLLGRVFAQYGIPLAADHAVAAGPHPARARSAGRRALRPGARGRGARRRPARLPANPRTPGHAGDRRWPGRRRAPRGTAHRRAGARAAGVGAARARRAGAGRRSGAGAVPAGAVAVRGAPPRRRPGADRCRGAGRPGAARARPRGRGAPGHRSRPPRRSDLRRGRSCWRCCSGWRCQARRGPSLAMGPKRCCSPSRWRSAPGAFAPCSCAACRRASSPGRPPPSRSCPTSGASSWPRRPACGCAPARTRCPPSAICSTPRFARHRARVPGLPQLRRGGQPGPPIAVHRRCGGAAERRLAATAGAGACSPTSSGTRSAPPPCASAPARRPTAGRRPAASRPCARGCSARRRWDACAIARSSRRARSRPTPTARSAGSSSASCSPSR